MDSRQIPGDLSEESIAIDKLYLSLVRAALRRRPGDTIYWLVRLFYSNKQIGFPCLSILSEAPDGL